MKSSLSQRISIILDNVISSYLDDAEDFRARFCSFTFLVRFSTDLDRDFRMFDELTACRIGIAADVARRES